MLTHPNFYFLWVAVTVFGSLIAISILIINACVALQQYKSWGSFYTHLFAAASIFSLMILWF
jgi:hypothetical protein